MNVRIFLAHAVKLELETEEAYLKFSGVMKTLGNHDAAEFFSEMADFCSLHRDTAMRRAGFADSTDIHSIIASWPGSNTETPNLKDSEGPYDLDGVMSLAHAAETRAAVFYEEMARTTTNSQIRLHAEEFAAEERGHVLAIERFFGHKPY